jgi:hypothetical protein
VNHSASVHQPVILLSGKGERACPVSESCSKRAQIVATVDKDWRTTREWPSYENAFMATVEAGGYR